MGDVRERISRAPTHRERERWHAIWLLAQGWTGVAVAQALEREAHTIGTWVASFRDHGPPALAFEQSGGPLNRCQQAQLRAAVQAPPEQAGINLANWNWKVVRGFLEERFGAWLSRSSCLNPPEADTEWVSSCSGPRNVSWRPSRPNGKPSVGEYEYAALLVEAQRVGSTSADTAQKSGNLIQQLQELWEKATMGERRQLLLTMLDGVYVDAKDDKRIVALKPKPAFKALFDISTTKEANGKTLALCESPDDLCAWWSRRMVNLNCLTCLRRPASATELMAVGMLGA